MWLYGITIFLSAFLVFQVQLLLGKAILPWYGGVPAVWTTCMLFFQSALLVGYAYAHWLAARPRLTAQRNLHLLLVAVSLALLSGFAVAWQWPLLPDAGWRPHGGEAPVAHILLLLGAVVGAPFLVLSATAPLVQRWFSLTHPGQSPYRLYALSNIGSLTGLLSYPFLVEVFVPLRMQALFWTLGYLLFAAGIATAAIRVARRVPEIGPAVEAAAGGDARAARPGPGRVLLWFGLTACASVLLLAITNQMSQEIAVIPFLWMLPLALYLLTFVLCFAGEHWYPRPLYLALFVPALVLVTLALQRGVEGALLPQVLLYSGSLFVICMVCHGELVRRKPHPRYLTAFYLTLSAGGAAGGVFVGVLAPLLFPGYWELSIALMASALLVGMLLWREPGSPLHRHGFTRYGLPLASVLLAVLVYSEWLAASTQTLAQWVPRLPVVVAVMGAVALLGLTLARRRAMAVHAGQGGASLPTSPPRVSPAGWRGAALAAALGIFGLVHIALARESVGNAIELTRNFFGVLQVTGHVVEDDEIILRLTHGRTVHGVQYASRARRSEPTLYYTPSSGIGLALRQHPQRLAGQPMRVGVVGLGIGTLASYGRAGDIFRFYEIDPDVVRLAAGTGARFSYLRDSAAEVEIVLGDARVSLEREAPQQFDLLVLDAFSSGSIPLHLLTREAFALYLMHLQPQTGMLAVHISNRYLDLTPVVATLARHLEVALVVVEHHDPAVAVDSTWLLLARDAAILPASGTRPVAPDRTPWSDDFSNLLQAYSHVQPETAGGDIFMKHLDEDARLLDLAR